MKLGNFFVGNVFTISQSPHGSTQNGKAIDAVPTSGNRLIAPCDMNIYYRANNLGHQSYSYARGDGFTRLVLVHCIVEKSGFVKRGTDIGYLASGGPVHLHTAIEVNGAWDVVLNYMDRTVQLALTSGFSSQHWKSWSTWKDLNLGTNNMSFTIPSQDYEYAKQYIPTFVQKYGGDLKGMDQYIWFFKHGAQRMNELLAAKDNEINKLNGALGGMTTDRNKYADMVKELQSKLDGETLELNRLKIELEDTKKALEVAKVNYDMEVEAHGRCVSNQQPLVNENEDLKAKVETLNTELDKVIKAYTKLVQDKKGIEIRWGDIRIIFERFVRKIKAFLAKQKT